MAKRLEMVFKNTAGRSFTLGLDEARDNLTAAEVQAVMDLILSKNIFQTSGGDLVAVAEARLVSRDVSELLSA